MPQLTLGSAGASPANCGALAAIPLLSKFASQPPRIRLHLTRYMTTDPEFRFGGHRPPLHMTTSSKSPIAKSHIALLLGVLAVLVWSAWKPYDRLTWWLETFPTTLG